MLQFTEASVRKVMESVITAAYFPGSFPNLISLFIYSLGFLPEKLSYSILSNRSALFILWKNVCSSIGVALSKYARYTSPRHAKLQAAQVLPNPNGALSKIATLLFGIIWLAFIKFLLPYLQNHPNLFL